MSQYLTPFQMTVPTKRVANNIVAYQKKEIGGEFEITQARENGRRVYVISQTKTREQVQQEQAFERAKSTLDPMSDWLGKESPTNIYLERDKIKKILDKFAERFANNPIDAFTWGTDTVQDAAGYEALSLAIHLLEEGRTDEQLAEYFTDKSEREDRYERLSYSTSPMSNLCKRAQRIATREVARRLRDYVKSRAVARAILEGATTT
jgi:predicted RNA-binding protein YlxR (DUF448 family)